MTDFPQAAPGLECDRCGAKFSRPRELSGHISGKHLRTVGMKNASVRLESLTDIQVGYLAAFLDGEGGIQITRTERVDRVYKIALHPTVYFTNTCAPAIEAIRDWIGAGSKVVSRSRGRRKDLLVLHVTGIRNIEALLRVLFPHLIVKSEQAAVMLAFCRSRLSHYRSGDRKFSERELELYTSLFRLNQRGVRLHANSRIADQGGEMPTGTL